MKKRLLCMLCAGLLVTGAVPCQAQEEKAGTETKAESEAVSQDVEARYGITEEQLQIFEDNVKEAVTKEYLEPNGIDPATFTLPELYASSGQEISSFWGMLMGYSWLFSFNMSLMGAYYVPEITSIWGNGEGEIPEPEPAEVEGVADAYNLIDILYVEFVNWYREVVCADEVVTEPWELIIGAGEGVTDKELLSNFVNFYIENISFQ